MSGIVGLWNRDGRPLEPALLSLMADALRHRGVDGAGRRTVENVGFATQHLWITPEEVGERQPLVGASGAMLVFDGRLDNREELLGRLDLPRNVSDTMCALFAFERWGEAFAERLNGDFALGVFDPNNQRLVLARDPIGIRPLYYFGTDRLFLFASEIKALLAHPDVTVRPDEDGVADFMLLGFRRFQEQHRTCFADISAVMPAHVVRVTAQQTVVNRYWDFDPARTIACRSFPEYAEGFAERFREAVRRRLRSTTPVAVSVSGGLDSSSILCQAQQLAKSGNERVAKVIGISYTGVEASEADEAVFVRSIESHYGIDVEQFPIEPFVHLDGNVEELIRRIEMPLCDSLWGVASELYRRASAHGARVVMSGHWGDQILFSTAYLCDLARRLKWRQVRSHLREYDGWLDPGEGSWHRRQFVRTMIGQHLPTRAIKAIKWVERNAVGTSPQIKPWFSDQFVRNGLRLANQPASENGGGASAHARSIYAEARSRYHVQCMEWHNKAAAPSGLVPAFPFLDRDLIAFIMAIPGEIQNFNGVPRGLLRESMRGVLPETIRLRKGKADFTSLVNDAVADGRARFVRDLTQDSFGVRLGFIDGQRLAKEIGRSSPARSTSAVESWQFADLLGLEAWLRIFLANRN